MASTTTTILFCTGYTEPINHWSYTGITVHSSTLVLSHTQCACPSTTLPTRPHSFCRLPKEEAFSFKSGDNDRRWVLKFDFPLIEEDTVPPISKELLLDFQTDWEYASSLTCKYSLRSKASRQLLQMFMLSALHLALWYIIVQQKEMAGSCGRVAAFATLQ